MLPTLKNNDRLLVMKGEYPSRYNLITFVPKNKEKESYIKRVLGLPGDRIWLDQNNLYINHQMSSSNLTPENESALLGSELPDGTLKVRVSWEVAAKLQGISSIPEHQYFVLGDNRRHSTDSRQLGLIDFKQIEGVVRFRYYPLDRLGSIN
ncbi:signal peptidase I [Enterococcus quebecensis]|uniref:Signal peptidase I n=2 Tax=Enterococcus quebecensis TaxID=903983 RepID=A0A1E5GS13_9ENTE|nr:signal peptidase I [Enterococcus quebecensis]OJG74778.1 signal peptidase I [Enterococcus quebecensis]